MISKFSVWTAMIFPPAAALLVLLYVIWQDPYIEKRTEARCFGSCFWSSPF